GCGGGPVRILAEMGANRGNVMQLYSVSTGGVPVATANGAPYEFSIPSVTTHTTFYVESWNTATGCRSQRTPIAITVPGAIAPPAVSNVSICGGGVATFTGSFSLVGAEVRLYTQALGGSVVASDINTPYRLRTPAITTTTTFYISLFSDGCESARVPAIATVNPLPAEPTVRNVARCGSGSVTFTAIMNEPSGTFIDLYTQATEGVDLAIVSASSNPYLLVTPSISTTTTYYVASVNDITGCRSNRVSVVATINPIPAAPNLVDSAIARCGPGVVNFSVQMGAPAGNMALLYRDQCSGRPLAEDNTPPYVLSTPLLNQTTDFFVAVRDANTGCQSACRSVKASIIDVSTRLRLSNSGPICAGAANTVTFTASGAMGATEYIWSGPNGFSTTTFGPTLTRNGLLLSDAGTYSVAAIMAGCTTSPVTTVLEIRATPAPPMPMCYSCNANSPNSICAGQNLVLGLTPASFAGYTAGTNFIWNSVGYSATTSAREITRTSVAPSFSGTYSVVAVAGGCTSSVSTVEIDVANIPPTPTASNNGPFCTGSTQMAKLYARGSGSEVTYHWNGPNSYRATGDSVAVASVITNAGTYSVVAVNAAGCSSQVATTTLSVIPSTPAPRAISNAPICEGQELALRVVEPVSGISYTWSGPAGFSQEGVIVTRSNALLNYGGIYTLTARASDCPSATVAIEVIVNPIPAPPTVERSIRGCVGSSISLAVTGGAKTSYYWQGPAGFTSTLPNPTISAARVNNQGTYSVVAISNGCTSAAAEVQVEVITVNSPRVASNAPVCEGQNLTLSAENDNSNVSYLWQGPARFVSESQNPIIRGVTSSEAGAYSVVAIANGCTSAPSVVNVNVNPLPAKPRISSNAPLCAGATLQLSTNSQPGFSYNWSGPANFTSTQQNPTITNVTTAQAGTYSLVLVAGTCSSEVAILDVAVSANRATLLGRDTSICVGAQYELPIRLSGTGPFTITYTLGAQRLNYVTEAFSDNEVIIRIPIRVRESTTIRIQSVVDAAGCINNNIPGSVNITAIPAPQATLRANSIVVCNGSSSELVLDISGGDAPWQLGWSINGAVQPSELVVATPARIPVSPTATTTYAFTSITGSRGCTTALDLRAVATVVEPPIARVTTQSISVCAGTAAQIPITVEVPVGSNWRLQYRLGVETSTLTGNGPGRFSLTTPVLSDTSLLQLTQLVNTSIPGCSSNLNTNINLIVVRPRLTVAPQPVTCSEGGSITVTATQGTPPYTFGISGAANQSNNTGNFFNLPAGNYNVRVVDANGCEASLSNVVVQSIAAPTILSVAPTCSTAAVSWQNLGGAIYSARYRLVGSANWSQISNLLESSVILTGLQANAQYEIQVQSICNRQTSAWSSSTNFSTTVCTPSVNCQTPEGIAIQAGSTSLQVSWLAVQGAVNYTIEYRLAGSTNWQMVSANSSPFTITGLSSNTAYEVRIITNCSGGIQSSPSPINRAATTSECSTLPLSIVGGTTGCGSLNLAPSIPDLPGLSYTWKFNGVTVANTREYRATFSGIYQLEVRQGSCPAQVASQRVNISGNAPGITATPTAASCSSCNDGSILVTILSGSGPFEYTLGDPVNGPYQSSNIFNGLTPGNYTVTVRTVGSACSSSVAISVGILPPAPRIVSARANRSNSAIITWEAAPELVSYNVQYRPVGQGTWLQVSNLTGTSVTLLGLSAGTSYQVRIQGLTTGGQLTAWSAIYQEPVSFTTPANKEMVDEVSRIYAYVYPNPTQGNITLQIRSSIDNNLICSVFDATGRLIYTKQQSITVGNQELEWDLSNLPAGYYWLRLEADGFKQQIKIIKY
ncbi:MAG: fibronectin type III domain-containing protein, partial [Bacteroidia bacterium]|nr:fibronectin type III domain-containing protein [Bacteroidia bacterium]